MRQDQTIGLIRRGTASLVRLNHAAAAAGVARHRWQGHGVVRRHQPCIHQRAQQRNRACGVAAGVGHAGGGLHRFKLAGAQLRETIDPVRRHAVGGRCINDLDGAAGFCGDAVDQRHRLACGIVVQTQDDQIHLGNQRPLGRGVLAQLGRNADQFHTSHTLQAVTNLQTRGASFAINKDFGHCSMLPRSLAHRRFMPQLRRHQINGLSLLRAGCSAKTAAPAVFQGAFVAFRASLGAA